MQAALERDVQDTLNGWKSHLSAASFILIHAPSANAAALFAGGSPPLSRSDPRVRNIPFVTRHDAGPALSHPQMFYCPKEHIALYYILFPFTGTVFTLEEVV